MTLHLPLRRRLSMCAALLFASVTLSFAQTAPKIERVDPPNWWAGFEPQVMLLLTGDGLAQASVTTTASGVRVTRIQPGSDVHYLFVWLETHAVRPGNIRLRVRTPA